MHEGSTCAKHLLPWRESLGAAEGKAIVRLARAEFNRTSRAGPVASAPALRTGPGRAGNAALCLCPGELAGKEEPPGPKARRFDCSCGRRLDRVADRAQ